MVRKAIRELQLDLKRLRLGKPYKIPLHRLKRLVVDSSALDIIKKIEEQRKKFIIE